MSKVTYPRACPKCGKKIKNRGNFFRHKKHWGTSEHRVQCPHCPKTYSRKDDLKKDFKNAHSKAAKRKAEESAELLRMELLNSEKVPRLSLENQKGGAVTTCGTKREDAEGESKQDVKIAKPGVVDPVTEPTDEYGGGPDPLYVADFKKLGPAKRWKKNTLVNQKFIITLRQKRGPRECEDLNIGATHALAVAMNNLIEDLQIPDEYLMALQIGSTEHRKEGLTGET